MQGPLGQIVNDQSERRAESTIRGNPFDRGEVIRVARLRIGLADRRH
jgi:hypothetical protein